METDVVTSQRTSCNTANVDRRHLPTNDGQGYLANSEDAVLC